MRHPQTPKKAVLKPSKTKKSHRPKCDYCTKRYTQTKTNQRFCSSDCKDKWHSESAIGRTIRQEVADTLGEIRLELFAAVQENVSELKQRIRTLENDIRGTTPLGQHIASHAQQLTAIDKRLKEIDEAIKPLTYMKA